ncbi:MAG: type II CAAX prenyl endopeptidase Rce1 family protein [Myxococcaceae bacterium]
MTSETPPTQADDEKWPPAKAMFFAAMGAGFFPCVAAPVPWILYVLSRKEKTQTADQIRWTKRILIIAIVDLLVIAAALFLFAHRKELTNIKAAKQKSMIGLSVEDAALKDGVKVSVVSEGSPAEAANIAVGDLVDTCDGKPVRSNAELRACVGNHSPEDQVALTVHRGEVTRELKLFTKAPDALAGKGKSDAPVCKPLELPANSQLFALGVFLALGIFVVVRKGGPAVLALAMALPVISIAGHFATQALCLHTALSNGVRGLIELPFSPLSLLAVAVLVDRFTLQNQAPKLLSGDRHWLQTGLLAIWLHVTGIVRVALILGAILIATHSGPIEATPVEELIAEGAKSPFIKVLFFITAAVLAPLAEERFFRGVMMEGLMRVMRPWMAVASVALVFGLLHGGYGIRAAVVVYLACVLGWARVAGRGLKSPILLHAAQNTVVGLLFLLR